MAIISIRQQIKNKFKEYLSTITIRNKTPGIFFNDPQSLANDNDDNDELPAICIQTINEEITTSTLGYPRTQERQLTVEISCLYQASRNLDEIAEEFTTLIESKLSENENVVKLDSTNGIITRIELTSIEFRFFDDIASDTGGAVLNYTVYYICEENNLMADI